LKSDLEGATHEAVAGLVGAGQAAATGGRGRRLGGVDGPSFVPTPPSLPLTTDPRPVTVSISIKIYC
jgi:hypothetical protein